MSRVRLTVPTLHENGYPHREHRSKKNRHNFPRDEELSFWFKKKRKRIVEEEIQQQLKNLYKSMNKKKKGGRGC